MNKKKQLPKEVTDAIDGLKVAYIDSPATTNAGAVIRTIVRFLPMDFLLKALVHKADKK